MMSRSIALAHAFIGTRTPSGATLRAGKIGKFLTGIEIYRLNENGEALSLWPDPAYTAWRELHSHLRLIISNRKISCSFWGGVFQKDVCYLHVPNRCAQTFLDALIASESGDDTAVIPLARVVADEAIRVDQARGKGGKHRAAKVALFELERRLGKA